MKKIIIAGMLLVMSTVLLTGCGGQRYAIVTDDYSVHIAKTKPVVDANSGTITFKDSDGRDVSIPRYKMKQIREIN